MEVTAWDIFGSPLIRRSYKSLAISQPMDKQKILSASYVHTQCVIVGIVHMKDKRCA